jgi:hypothetical protein
MESVLIDVLMSIMPTVLPRDRKRLSRSNSECIPSTEEMGALAHPRVATNTSLHVGKILARDPQERKKERKKERKQERKKERKKEQVALSGLAVCAPVKGIDR